LWEATGESRERGHLFAFRIALANNRTKTIKSHENNQTKNTIRYNTRGFYCKSTAENPLFLSSCQQPFLALYLDTLTKATYHDGISTVVLCFHTVTEYIVLEVSRKLCSTFIAHRREKSKHWNISLEVSDPIGLSSSSSFIFQLIHI
jgi:hypothetical protein